MRKFLVILKIGILIFPLENKDNEHFFNLVKLLLFHIKRGILNNYYNIRWYKKRKMEENLK